MVRVLMVAEKPSICTSVARALGGDDVELRNRSPPVYEFTGDFQGQPATFVVTSVTGHVFSLDFPGKYQNWDIVDPNDLFDAPTQKTAEGRGGMVKHLEREAKGAEVLVLWMDCDREGENICYEVIDCVKHVMKKTGHRQTYYRARFSAVTKKDIEKAISSLVAPNENEAKSVDARQEMDLKVGVAFSRFQTRYFQGKYGNLDSSVISYGPCQTPTLGFCVERYDEIQSFVPEPFWTLDAALEVPGRAAVHLNWARGRIFDQSVADTFALLVGEAHNAVCTDTKTSDARLTRPQPLNTVTLLKLSSRVLGIGPQATMRAAEHLYLSGYLSYPRTESTAYPSSYDIREALHLQRDHLDYGRYVQHLLHRGHTVPRQGHDAGDHPPITPVGLATDLIGDSARVYDLVLRHFLATVSPDARYEVTTAKFRAGSEAFAIRGRREIDPGFLAIYGRGNISEEAADEENGGEGDENDQGGDFSEEMPAFVQGQAYALHSVRVRSGQTKAPGFLTESELITKMEKNGIGTDASISTHINNILVRSYVTLGPGRTLVPTDLGTVLVHGYLRIDPDLVLPNVRATIETFCSLVAKGEASKEDVVKHSLTNFQRKFEYFRTHIGAMDALFEASFDPLAASGKSLSKCGRCMRYMKFISLKPQRLYCPTCEQTYGLPQNGTVKLYKETKCPLDNFELLLYSLGNSDKAQGKSFPLCPYCYNFPPRFEEEDSSDEEGDAAEEKEGAGEEGGDAESESDGSESLGGGGGHMGCNSCMHPSCKQSAALNGVCPCSVFSASVPSSAVPAPSALTLTDRGGRGQRGGRGGGRDGGREGRAGRGRGRSGAPDREPTPDVASLPCAYTCEGLLVLDMNSKPNWKLACNLCNTLVRFRADLHSVAVQSRRPCLTCRTKTLELQFNKLTSPLPGGETRFVGCIRCDPLLAGMTEVVVGRSISVEILRQQRHRRRLMAMKMGKGRGGRGRGKKRNDKASVLMSFDEF